MPYELNLRDFQKKTYHSLGDHFRGENPDGNVLSFTNYYMEQNGTPFFGVSGELHFSRCDEHRWEDEILKMKMCGINIISTYVFWIHHEEEEGIFDFSGSKDLRRFVKLCQKHGMYVILRIGPFAHGEVRNGGLPDWLYGKSFEARKLNDGFLSSTRQFYAHIAAQIKGLLYKDGGPVIAAQIDNEYMHSSAVWEMTTGISDEWIFMGDDGENYMLTLRDLAIECGIETPFYTCTAWGGAIAPDEMLPLWGGYSYRPWLFYTERGEHPLTEEYIYQDYHNNTAVITSDFKPSYTPEERPYACCEMGGGMMCTYNYRFAFPFKSVDAMANIKLASGCNFLGYYVFQGGSNPRGKHGTFMNESQTPKISYDYQAALGEYGQIRKSYQRLKALHYFTHTFCKSFCQMQTVLPEGASFIEPDDLDTLRYAVRTDGRSGFLFLNNFQDHAETKWKRNESVTLHMKNEDIIFSNISLAPDENCILPFHMDVAGIGLITATAQPVTVLHRDVPVFVFLKPDGMDSVFYFEENAITDQGGNIYRCTPQKEAEVFHVRKQAVSDSPPEPAKNMSMGTVCEENICLGNIRAENICAENIYVEILCLDRTLADQMYVLSDETLIFTEDAVMEDADSLRLETTSASPRILTYPRGACTLPWANGDDSRNAATLPRTDAADRDVFDVWSVNIEEKKIPLTVKQTASSKYEISFHDNFMEGLKDALLQIDYRGDIGHTFIDGDMVSDNFCNNNTWEIGLRTFAGRLGDTPLTLSISPLRKGANVNVESAMAARAERVEESIAELISVTVRPVYEVKLR